MNTETRVAPGAPARWPARTSLIRVSFVLAAAALACAAAPGYAATGEEIDARVREALTTLYEQSPAADELGARAAGILVFPRVLKGGFGLGGAFGEGALLVGGETVQYYRVAAASVGFQIGGQARSEVLMFMNGNALEAFRASNGWEAGVDGSVALAQFGAGEQINTSNVRDPIIGFVYGNRGLMYNLSLEGSKYWKIDK
jgi:lipid-binding SYLF domain-containing protein